MTIGSSRFYSHPKTRTCPGGPKCCCPTAPKKYRAFSHRLIRHVDKLRVKKEVAQAYREELEDIAEWKDLMDEVFGTGDYA